MKTMRIGIIRVVTLDDEALINAHGQVIERAFPCFNIVSRCIPDQCKGIYNQATLKIATPKVVSLGLQLQSEGIEALIVSCAEDPGVETLRRSVEIPVIGAGSAAAGLALTLGAKVGVLNLTARTPKAMTEVLRKHLVAEAKPRNITSTLDLLKDKMKSEVLHAAATLRNRGVDVVVLGCTGYTTMGVASEIQTELKLPVIDPILAAGLAASYTTQLPRTTRSHGDSGILHGGE